MLDIDARHAFRRVGPDTSFQIFLAEDQLCVVVTGAGIIFIVNNLRVSRTQAVKNRCSMIARSGRANARSVAIITADRNADDYLANHPILYHTAFDSHDRFLIGARLFQHL